MIKIHTHQSESGETAYLWNVSSRKQLGSRGLEVQLIQYLLFSRSRFLADGAYGIGEVDGNWGRKTETYMEINVRKSRISNQFVDDHYISPMPPGETSFNNGQKSYKLSALQYGYIVHMAKVNPDSADLDTRTENEIILGMPDDGFCPSQLAAALRTAKAANGL